MDEYKPRPAVVDAIVLRKAIATSSGFEGELLLVKRGKEPEMGKWALPGGYIDWDETAAEAVVREAREESGVEVRPLKIIGVYSSPKRDPVRQNVAIAFLCEFRGGELRGGDDAAEAKWWPLYGLPELAFDHKKIIKDALEQI